MPDNQTLEKLQAEKQAVTAELKARKKAFKKMKRETFDHVRVIDLNLNLHTKAYECERSRCDQISEIINETVVDLQNIGRHMIAAKAGHAPDLSGEMIGDLTLKLTQKLKDEYARFTEMRIANEELSDKVFPQIEALEARFNAEKAAAAEFSRQAEARIKELEESIKQAQAGHE